MARDCSRHTRTLLLRVDSSPTAWPSTSSTLLRDDTTLRDEGLLEVRRGRGTIVTDKAPIQAQLVERTRELVAEARLAGLNDHDIRTGLRVKYGWLPMPTTHVSVADIETAQVIDVRPREWGGWGYRGSLKSVRRAAVVHRAGPGIRLDLRDGKVVVVTIDDADTGAALLNALIQRGAAISPPIR